MTKKYLVTSALPYANGPLHYGHMAGVYIPADIYVRHLKLCEQEVMHICGSDEHGVAIILGAKKVKQDYKSYVDGWHKEHKELFDAHQIEFDFFGQTSAPYHSEETLLWFKELHTKGLIEPRQEEQLYHEDCQNFLPDRFVEGTCYECGHQNARGDECPNCGILIDAIKLIDPVCKICGGNKNIKVVESTQYYLLLSKYHKEYRQWLEGKVGSWRKTVGPYVDSLTKESLQDRAITRDLDWGIDVPLEEAKGKKLYVWFDAPIGYVSNTKEFLRQKNNGQDYLKDWWQNKDCEIVNFLGKDNIIFHAIIFPVMSMASGRVRAVDDVAANQYLNLEGKQFSKSQGHYVDAKEAVGEFGPDAIRYYLISILPETSDSSFTWEGLGARVNGELANNIGNLVSRCLKFFQKNWPLGIEADDFLSFLNTPLAKSFASEIEKHQKLLNERNFRLGLETVMGLGLKANLDFSEKAPWAQIKTDTQAARLTIAQTSAQILILGVLLSPYLPMLSQKLLKAFPGVDEKIKKNIYQGKLEALKEVFKDCYTLGDIPAMLVPKIDEAKIKSKSLELASKNA